MESNKRVVSRGIIRSIMRIPHFIATNCEQTLYSRCAWDDKPGHSNGVFDLLSTGKQGGY